MTRRDMRRSEKATAREREGHRSRVGYEVEKVVWLTVGRKIRVISPLELEDQVVCQAVKRLVSRRAIQPGDEERRGLMFKTSLDLRLA